jgi:putative lipoic acid-binding regulatory protein
VPVARQAMKSRPSSAGKYQCVSVVVSLQNRDQLEAIYAALRMIDDLKYLL